MENYVGLWMFTVAFAGFISGISCGIFLCACYPKILTREPERAAGVALLPKTSREEQRQNDPLQRSGGENLSPKPKAK